MPDPALLRVLVLSPSTEHRQEFFGALFGTFELSPQGRGEKRRIAVGCGGLEVVGAGEPSRLATILQRLVEGGVQIDGVLVLLMAGDQEGWGEVQKIGLWQKARGEALPLKTWVFDRARGVGKEEARRALLALLAEQEKALAPP